MADDNLIKRSWRQLVFDVPRFRVNAKSRRRVLIQMVLLVVFSCAWALYVGGLAFFEYRFAGGWWAVLWVAIMYALALSIRKVMKSRGNAITLSIDSTPSPHLRKKVLDQRLILATVVARGVFEAALRSGAIAEGAERNARAGQNQRLRREELWEDLPGGLRELLASPEGSWNEIPVNRALLYAEGVRVLNWLVREDCELADLRLSQTVGAQVLWGVLKEPDPARAINFLRPRVEVQREGHPTRVYLARLTSELVRRGASDGQQDALLDQNVEAYMRYAAYVGEADIVADDLPVGGRLIGEAETAVLLRLRGTVAVRLVVLEAILEILDGRGLGALVEVIEGIVQK